jgi:hypothetical protein
VRFTPESVKADAFQHRRANACNSSQVQKPAIAEIAGFYTPLSSEKRISIEQAGDPDGIFRSNGIEKSPTFRGKSRFKGDRHLHKTTAVKS